MEWSYFVAGFVCGFGLAVLGFIVLNDESRLRDMVYREAESDIREKMAAIQRMEQRKNRRRSGGDG